MHQQLALVLWALVGLSFADNTDSTDADDGLDRVITIPGGSATLPCFDDVIDNHQDVQWFKADNLGSVITESENRKLNVNASEPGTLTIRSVGESDMGAYVCRTPTMNVTRILDVSPYVISSSKSMPKSLNHVEGEPASILCTAWGHPTPKITWVRVLNMIEKPLENSSLLSIAERSDGSEIRSNLMIKELVADDYADYYCIADNRHGEFNRSSRLRVKGKLAPLWPFIGIIAEIIILVVIIVIYEKRKSKQNQEEENKEKAENQTTVANDHKNDEESVRFRK